MRYRDISIAVVALGVVIGGYALFVRSAKPADTRVIHYVALHASSSDPADLLIKVGEFVEFDSKDGKTHNISSGAGNADGEKHDHAVGADELESGDFAADEGYLAQFKKVGTYYFHDHLNPNIHISVGVYDPNVK
jgi:plastocyanin